MQISSSALSFNYFSNWNSANTGSQANSISVGVKNPGVYNYRIIGVPAAGSTTNTTSTNTTICELDSGTVEIKEKDNNQILLRDIETIQPGCNPVSYTHLTLPTIYSV